MGTRPPVNPRTPTGQTLAIASSLRVMGDDDTIDGVVLPPSEVPGEVSGAVTNPFTCVVHLYAFLLVH